MIHTAFGFDGSVRIKADLNHNNFDRGLSAMQHQVDKFGSTLKKLAGTVALAFGTAAFINFGKEAVKAASALNDAWLGLESIISGQGKSFSKAKAFINDYISDGLVPLENAVTAYKNLAARGYSTEQIEKTLNALKDAAAFGRQASYSLGDAVSSATEGLKNENSILVDNAGVTKNVAKMWDDYARSIGTTANNLTQEQKIQAEVNGILEETRFQTGDAAKLVNTYSGQLAMLGYNFQQLKVAVGNALIPIAQAVLPGINAIISALTKLAHVFAKVTAMLFGKSTQVKATTGVESSAGAAADATDKLAESTAGMGEASKKAEKDMKGVQAGFDELNILAGKAASSMEDAAGGMGGIGGAGIGGDLEIPSYEAEQEEINGLGESFETLGDLFNATLDSILEGLPTFREALLSFAESFNEFNQKLYDAFTADGVKEKVERLGRELAEILNEFVKAINWELWGRTLGAGLNLGLQFLTEFLYTFDWIELGKRLAMFINGLVYEVDWYDFGRLLWAKFKLALETFAGFIIGLDMPALAQAASDIIIGFFNSMQETIETIDWAAIGRQIAEFLNNIDWAGVISSIASAIGAMIPAALELIGGFIQNADTGTLIAAALFFGSKLLGVLFSKVISPIATQIGSDLIKQIAETITKGNIGSILSAIGKALAPLGSAIAKAAPLIGKISAVVGGALLAVSNFLDMLSNGFSWVNEALMLLGIAIAGVGAVLLGAPALVTAVVAGIVAVVATLAVLVKEHWEEIKQAFIDAWNAIQEAWNAAGEWFSEHVIQPVAEFFSNLWESVTEAASNAWNNIQNIWNIVSGWFNENIIEPVRQFFSEMWENIQQLASDAWDGIISVWQAVSGWFNDNIIKPVSEFFGGLWDGIQKGAGDLWDKIVNVWNQAASWFETNVTKPIGDAFQAVGNFVKDVFNGIIGFIEGIINGAIGGINWLIDQLNKISFDVPDWVPAIGGKSFGFNVSHVSEVKLPRLANGAVIPPNQQFAAILGDQRSGKNLEAPAGLIRQMVAEGMQAAMAQGGGFGRGGNMTVIMEIDGREFGRASYKYGTAESQRVGVRLVEVGT